MSDYDVEQAAELAAKAFFLAQVLPWLVDEDPVKKPHIYCGLENEDTQVNEGRESSIIILPCLICSCEVAEPVLPNYHGNWNAELSIEIRSNSYKTTGIDHADRVRSISKLVYTDTFADDLSKAIPEFFVTKWVPGTRTRQIRDKSWVNIIPITLISCSNITV